MKEILRTALNPPKLKGETGYFVKFIGFAGEPFVGLVRHSRQHKAFQDRGQVLVEIMDEELKIFLRDGEGKPLRKLVPAGRCIIIGYSN